MSLLISSMRLFPGWRLTCPASNQAQVFGCLDLRRRLFICLDSKDTWGVKVQALDRAAPSARRQAAALTSALVDKQPTGSSEVDGVVDLEALQVLTHLPTLGEFRVDIFEVDLPTGEPVSCLFTQLCQGCREHNVCVDASLWQHL